tara:strand:- start:5103 stop:5753 length:651 start_codon:yes stop_codon:yes gene_type:complete
MRISHKHKFIFTAIPKTGTTTIGNVLDRYVDVRYGKFGWSFPGMNRNQNNSHEDKTRHAKLDEVKKDLFADDIETFDSYFKFTFVRNPWDRCVSSWFYALKRAERGSGPHIDLVKKYKTFQSWVGEKLYKSAPDSCSCWLFDSAENQIMDFIGRFENLQEDFNTICDKIGIPHQQLPHRNKSKHTHYTEYYDDETKQIVAEKFAKDIEYFGYEYGK